ncbi:YadA C-terminal domain-containing protein [Edwardsiella tarda]|uniref:YadA C-terminal domain-containing protein n=1 Tax=Edwardsiella tarda TaxID=636 RepID=UPI00083A0202|nr:YadA C-terminal domain-containing protein [Edwardsiella tarda]
MKRHTLAALISSLFVLSSAYGYADDTISDATAMLPVPSPEEPVAPPAAPATLNAAELAAVAKGLPQIAPHIQTQAEQSVKTSLAATEYFQTQVQNIIKASGEAEKLRNITNKVVNNPLIRKIILEPMAKYKVQVDGVKAVENYAGYMSSVYRSSADMAAIAALKAASEANQQSFLFNAALHDALTSNQARAHQVYNTLHAYTSTHVVDYNLGKLAQRVLIDQPKIDTLMKNLLPAVFQPAYQENMVGLLASLQQANTSVERIQQAQQFATMLTDNKVVDKLNRAALLAAVQESYQGVQSNQRALTQLQQAHQADLTMAHVVAIGAADAVKKANEASIAAASATLNQSLQDNQRAEQQARQASLTAAHVVAIGAADAVKKANDTALRVAQKANADAIHEAKEALSQDIHGNQQNTLAANLMALGALKGVQETTTELQNLQRSSNASSHAFNTALNDSKRELSAAIQANSHSLSRRIDENRKKAAAGIAGVAAMSNIPIPYAEGSFTVGVGVGYYDSQSAGAIGIGKGFENGLAIKASASFATDSNVAIGGGASWSF